MSDIHSLIYKHIVSGNSPRETYVDNDKPVSPPHDVYPLSPESSKRLFDKNDPLDKRILELHRKKELDIKVVELKGPGKIDD